MNNLCDLFESIGSITSETGAPDITLIAEAESMCAHKSILASSCEYFRALLLGGLREASESVITLDNASVRAFKVVLKYIYARQLDLQSMDLESSLDVLCLAPENGNIDSREPGRNSCRILSRDSFCAEEIDIFKAVARWCETNPDQEDQAEVLNQVRLPLIATKKLVTNNDGSSVHSCAKKAYFVNHLSFQFDSNSADFGFNVEISTEFENWISIIHRPNGFRHYLQKLYFEPKIVRFVRLQCQSSPRPEIGALSEFKASHIELVGFTFDGYYAPAKNVASFKSGALIDRCSKGRNEMIGGTSTDDLAGSGWTEHEIGGEPISLQLPQPNAVNIIEMQLPEEYVQQYAYYLETSTDNENWIEVIERSADNSLRRFEFPTRAVSFIKVVSTASPDNQGTPECPQQLMLERPGLTATMQVVNLRVPIRKDPPMIRIQYLVVFVLQTR
ncbi:BTB/POZ domain-containing protein 9-like [Galendromus occidentalis]|uniref:BTB/POZ domain-containing protein 9-like n=1 Tax=Galendromus occidentalis TaxID=34638 RepID=A0AAJ7L7I9_9ACAR|nr:BTB/POZ domain-containing protein 9-like [Galendromus occidentalis]